MSPVSALPETDGARCAPSQSTDSGIFVSQVSKHQPNVGGLPVTRAPGKNNFTAHAESESVQY